jgi:hypothetical protein
VYLQNKQPLTILIFEVFRVITPCSVQRFGGPCCFHLQDEITGTGEKGVYEGVSKSSRTESIKKYTLTFGITRCCPLQSIYLPSLCKGSSVSATARSIAGTDFLESRVGRSAIVPEFQ